MRLFVAVELADNVRRAADDVSRKLQQAVAASLRARWVSVDNMHLTVRFIGHVRDDRVPSVLDAVRPPLAMERFEIALGDCGAFPPHGPPRVLWIGLEQGLESLRRMHEEFNRRLTPLGFAPENRPYSAHLTLARVKDATRGSGATTRDAIRAVRVPRRRCSISHATLFQSRLSSNGATYARLIEIPLL